MLLEDDDLPRATEPPFLSAFHAKNDTANLFAIKLASQLTESNIVLRFFSGKETIQTFNSSI